MSRFLNRKYASLSAYTPGEQPRGTDYIKLNTNESPYAPAPEVLEVIDRRRMSDLRLYPDPECRLLRQSLARAYGTVPQRVFVCNGSDDALNFAFMAFGGAGAAFADITYGFYSVFAALHGVECTIVPLRDDFSVDPADYCGVGRTVFIANPNAPTGLCLSVGQIERIVESNPGNVVVVDEAYVDFGARSACSLTDKYDNLMVVRTFSKSRSLAGARLGFAVAQEPLIRDLELLKYSTNPYNVNRLTLDIGAAALQAQPYYDDCCRRIINSRQRAAERLRALGMSVTDSCANFLFARSPAVGGAELYAALKARGVLVRHFDSDRIRDYVRITVGTDAQMDALVSAVKEILEEKTR